MIVKDTKTCPMHLFICETILFTANSAILLKGETGSNGTIGIIGRKGAKGPRGFRGVKGDKGEPGSEGFAGECTLYMYQSSIGIIDSSF